MQILRPAASECILHGIMKERMHYWTKSSGEGIYENVMDHAFHYQQTTVLVHASTCSSEFKGKNTVSCLKKLCEKEVHIVGINLLHALSV